MLFPVFICINKFIFYIYIDAEEFISVTLSKESLTHETENKRQKLETRLKNLVNKSSGGPLPPRPPKSNATQEEEDEDLYDDVGLDTIEVKNEAPVGKNVINNESF